MMSFFPVRKIKRSGKYLFVGAVLVVVGVSGYLEYVATSTWSHVGDSQQKEQKGQIQCTSLGNRENIVWSSKYVSQPWKPEYKGKANLHVFEDWCGSSIASLRKNLHYPIYPHSRITVSKLAVSPSWKKYGLRIFGYIHPHSSGEFLFTVACKDNCEFWLSKDEKPDNLQLCAHVGMTGEEWTAPGEYGKYLSQISEPVILHQQKKNFFELIHKFSDYSSDHVEVAWRLNDDGTQFELIGSDSLSLYTDESSLKMSDINHIPQTTASHVALPQQTVQHGSEMLREDPRDTSFKLPLLDKSRLKHVLPECSYKPTYTIKGAEIGRYQGLQFVHLSYVYPNDYTRLTHMENRNPCFYMIKPYYLKMYGFSHYMQLEGEDTMFGENGEYREGWQDYRGMEQAGEDFEYYNGYVQHNQRKIFSQSLKRKYRRRRTTGHEMNRVETTLQENLPQNNDSISKSRNQHKLQNPNNVGNKNQSLVQNPKKMAHKNKQKLQKYNKIAGKSQYEIHNQTKMANASQHKVQGPKKIADDNQHKVQDPKKLADENQHKVQDPKKIADENQHKVQDPKKIADENQHKVQDPKKIASKNQQKLQKYIKMADKNPHEIDSQPNIVKENQYKLHKHKDMVEENQKLRGNDEVNHQKEGLKLIVQMNQRKVEDKAVRQGQKSGEKLHEIKRLKNDIRNIFLSTSKVENLQPSGNDSINHKHQHGFEEQNLKQSNHTVTFSARMDKSTLNNVRTEPKMQEDRTTEDTDPWVMPKDSEMDEDVMERSMYDSEIRWNQTFQISQTDFQTLKSDWIDLNCNVSGNLLIRQSEATTVVQAFMEKLHLKYPRRFFLQRILNIVKRVDGSRGNRYLLELELREKSGHFVRLVHYIYLLKGRRVHKSGVNTELLLCNPYSFQWNPDATIHIIVPVKNQARWVLKFIRDMEELHQVTKDNNINIIITDYSSTDMDIEQTLKQSHLPKYEYLRLTGNFERAAGLQAGIDLITNKHSIVFLCDLHLHFPLSFFNSVRKYCVEGHMAFAPLVMRLNCGATPQEPDGYWEVNGFGLLGIYKSDLDAIGGMNTRDFTNRWGGEDWELLDRIIEAGLEVERLYLRNFYHYHHSKRGMWNRKMLRRL